MKWSIAALASLRLRLSMFDTYRIPYAHICFRLCCCASVMTGPASGTFQVPVQMSRFIHVLARLGRNFDPKRKRVLRAEHQYSTFEPKKLDSRRRLHVTAYAGNLFPLGARLQSSPDQNQSPCLSIERMTPRLQDPRPQKPQLLTASSSAAYRGPKSGG